jgi:hypothetical protein
MPLESTGDPLRVTAVVSVPRDREMLAVAEFERAAAPDRMAGLRVEVDRVAVPHSVHTDIFPSCILASVPTRSAGPGVTEIAIVLPPTVSHAGVTSLRVIPARPALSARFPPTRLQRLKRRIVPAPADDGEGEFPLSHFDGLAYLRAYPEVEEAVRGRRLPSALEHYVRHGHAEGRRFALAVDGSPNAGTLGQLVEPEFDGLAYLRAHPDVARLVRRQELSSALHHYLHYGHAEGRPLPRIAGGAEGTIGNLYDLLHEELKWHAKSVERELWKGFSASLDEVRAELATTREQLSGLKAALVSAVSRAGIARPKLYVDVQHGLGNRLKSFVSASVVAERTGRELVLVWVADHHCQCAFSDLFQYDGPVMSERPPIDTGRMRVYNYMEVEVGAKKDERIDLDTAGDIYVRSAYSLNTLQTDWNAENRLLRSLKVTAPVRDLVDSIDVTGRLGVHVRMEGGTGLDAHSYDSGANWSKESHDLIQSWRARSHYANFMRRIDALLEEDPGLRLFLATDRDETYRIFREAYGGRLAFLRRPIFDRSREQLVYALADAILLGKCARFLGSTYSTFSELAERYSTGFQSIEMSGKDF